MAKIKSIIAREILNAKGLPTVEATVVLNDGKIGVASCPSGEKVSNYQTVDVLDNDLSRFEGKGVNKAIGNIETIIAPKLVGKEIEHQQEIDKTMIELDGTQNKSRLGSNAIFAVSMAAAKAGASSSALPLFLYLKQFLQKENESLRIPIPIFNFINGNRQNNLADFAEFLLIPASSKQYVESIQMEEIIHKSLKQLLESKFVPQGDYGEGFSPPLSSNREAFDLIAQAAKNTYVRLGFDVFFGLNARASNLFKNGKYHIKDSAIALSSKDLIRYYDEINRQIHLLYLEDPLDQNDWDGWADLFANMSSSSIIVGGDLIATNPYRLQMAIDKKTVNSIVLKPNQIGTVIEALAISEIAKEAGLKIIVSHRNTETNDDFIADFSVAISADYVKIGSLARGENIAKYNRLLQIENQIKIL